MNPVLMPGLGRGRVAATGTTAVDGSFVGLIVDCAGTFAANFAASATLGNQFQVAFYCTSGAVTLTANGAETIQSPAGSANTFVLSPGQGAYVSCDGTGLKIVLGSGLAPSPSATITTDTIQAATTAGIVLRNSAGTQVMSVGLTGTGVTFAGAVTATSASGITTLQASTQDAVRLLGRAGGTGSHVATITPTTLTASRTWTGPDASITIAGINLAQTWTAAQNFGSVGNTMGGGTYSADDSILLLRRESTAVPDSHAVRDETVYTVASGGGGYASFDAVAGYAGASAFNHLHAFQSRPSYAGTGSLVDLVGYWSREDHSGSGTVTNRRGAWIRDPTGSGAITNNYGIYVDAQTRGANDWAIYTNAGKVRLGDQLDLDSATAGTPTLDATASVAGDHGITIRNTNNGTGSYAYASFRNDVNNTAIFQAYSSGYTGTQFGITAANYSGFVAFGSDCQGLMLGLSGASVVGKPVIIGITNEIARFTGGTIASDQLAIKYTTDSSSTTTGSITTLGGISWGAGKSAYGGSLNLSGALTVASDTDVTTTLGRARIGSPASDVAYFAHFDRLNANDYALQGNASGGTRVNAANGQSVIIRNNDSDRLTISGTAVTLASGINLVMAGASTFTSGTGLGAFQGSLVVGGTTLVGSERLRINGGSTPAAPGANGVLVGAGQVRCGALTGFRSGSASGGALLLEDTSVADGGRPFSYINTIGGLTTIGNSNRLSDLTTDSIARITIAATGEVAVTSTTDTSSTATGGLTVGGGVGIAAGLQVGGVTTLRGGATSQVTDAVTNITTAALSLYHITSGTPAAGFGTSLDFRAQSSTGSNRGQGKIETLWVDATDASRKARLVLYASDTANIREGLRIESNGSVAMLGFFASAAVLQPSSTGETVGFTAGGGTTVTDASTFTGNVGATAYRVNDVVKHLKNLGLLAP